MFKSGLISSAGIKAYEGLFNEIIMMAMEKRVKFGGLQVVDSVHTIADVNLVKDERKRREDKPAGGGEARWGAKGDKLVADEEWR